MLVSMSADAGAGARESRAVGGAGLVLTEAAAVVPEGRITPGDLGIWKDEQVGPLARIVDFIHGQRVEVAVFFACRDFLVSLDKPAPDQRPSGQ